MLCLQEYLYSVVVQVKVSSFNKRGQKWYFILVLGVWKEVSDMEQRGWMLAPADTLVSEVLELITHDRFQK